MKTKRSLVFLGAQILLGLILVAFGYLSFDLETPKWAWLGIVLYSLPLMLCFLPFPLLRYYFFVFALFLAAQSIVPKFFRSSFFFAQPNFKKALDYAPGSIPGFTPGIHNLTTDSMGFRSTSPVNYSEAFSGVRIFTIGGSTTQMLDIDDNKTWSAHLEKNLKEQLKRNEIQVINAGLAGTRAEQNFGTLKFVKKFSPDLAIILVGTNDWRRDIINQVMREKGIQELEQPWEKFSLKNSLIGQLIYAWKMRNTDTSVREVSKFSPQKVSESERAEDCRKGEDIQLPPEFPTRVAEDFSKALEGIAKFCADSKLQCVLMTQPHAYRPEAEGKFRESLSCSNRWGSPAIPLPPGSSFVLRDVERMGKIAEFYNNFTREFAKTQGLQLCDIAAGVAGTQENFYDEVHYTEKGSALVAELVTNCVIESVKSKFDDKTKGLQ